MLSDAGEVGNPDARWRGKRRTTNALELSEGQNRCCTKQVKEGIRLFPFMHRRLSIAI